MNVNEILMSNLTQDQYNAVVDENRNVLCLACAGSGKSRTLAYKIAYLISQGVAPESIQSSVVSRKLFTNSTIRKTTSAQCLSVR